MSPKERLPEDHTVNLNGVDLHYRTIGNGPALFLVPPGWGVASGYLQRAFSSLSKHFKLVFIDTRGSGLSGRPVDPMLMRSIDMADDLEALRKHLDLSQISILGHSNSGAIALSYATRYPDRVNKLVLSGSQVLGLSAAADTQRILQDRSTDPRFEEATKVVSAFFTGQINPASSDESLETFIAQVLPLYLYNPEKSLSLARKHLSDPISSYAFTSQFAADRAVPTDQTKSLDTIKAKTLILVGRHDFICPVALSERLHEGIPESSFVIFEKSGHFPWLEETPAFFAELERFLLS
ncbi:alpha/beta fold hydrolase [Granulicella mallensis]|uniref:Alpha/beta hydrolase fold protein n=1 Tax=Granulicella mallensis (strain ATCC BAA-1857 / DSM 23137 / MP5ACTX8) TaxID=682795 RepID=G8NY36_GRAMM|nr:alpha/beta hydrolase [Granulicella mallensis]AEU36710.1 alpha/beta hydrolase fold protein [Granulicella mallensis MP5ACTX8]